MRRPSPRCFINTVSLYAYNPNQDEDGGAVFNLSTAQVINPSVPCSVQVDEPDRDYGEGQDRVAQVNTYSIYFGQNYGLNIKDVIVWIDGDSQVTHTMYVIGQINMAGRSSAWAVKARERI